MDGDRRRVILYGDSLVMEGLRASLEIYPDIETVFLDPWRDHAGEAIRVCCPAAFVFDLDAVQPDLQLSILQQPGLLLVCIEPETQQALIWTGRQVAAAVAADLVSAIRLADLDGGSSGEAISQGEEKEGA
jgi:hypothetical protein